MSVRRREHTKHVLAFALVFGAILAGALFIVGDVRPTLSSGGGPEMRIVVSDPPDACVGDVCQFAPGTAFTLSVEIITAPTEGYTGAKSYIFFGEELVYSPRTAGDEVVWPGCEQATFVRFLFPSTSTRIVTHGCLTGLLTLPQTSYVGGFLALSFNCSPAPSSTLVEFLPIGDPGAFSGQGAGFQLPAVGSQAPQTIAAKTNNLTVFCGDPPTPTPPPTITPGGPSLTPTPSATPSPASTPSPTPSPVPVTPTATIISTLPCGDVNGDRLVNSQDALWVLWFSTGTIAFLPFPDDVNGDGVTDPLDALHILWIELNLYICRR